jgi:hypothetical protein
MLSIATKVLSLVARQLLANTNIACKPPKEAASLLIKASARQAARLSALPGEIRLNCPPPPFDC